MPKVTAHVSIPPGFENVTVEVKANAEAKIELTFSGPGATVIGSMEIQEAIEIAEAFLLAVEEAQATINGKGGPA